MVSEQEFRWGISLAVLKGKKGLPFQYMASVMDCLHSDLGACSRTLLYSYHDDKSPRTTQNLNSLG